MLFDWANEAEAIDNLVSDKISVITANFAMMQVVILAAILYVGNQGLGQLFRLVLGNQIHHVIGNERGEPAYTRARQFQVFRGPDWCCRHDFDFLWVTARLAGAFADEAQAPLD